MYCFLRRCIVDPHHQTPESALLLGAVSALIHSLVLSRQQIFTALAPVAFVYPFACLSSPVLGDPVLLHLPNSLCGSFTPEILLWMCLAPRPIAEVFMSRLGVGHE